MKIVFFQLKESPKKMILNFFCCPNKTLPSLPTLQTNFLNKMLSWKCLLVSHKTSLRSTRQRNDLAKKFAMSICAPKRLLTIRRIGNVTCRVALRPYRNTKRLNKAQKKSIVNWTLHQTNGTYRLLATRNETLMQSILAYRRDRLFVSTSARQTENQGKKRGFARDDNRAEQCLKSRCHPNWINRQKSRKTVGIATTWKNNQV